MKIKKRKGQKKEGKKQNQETQGPVKEGKETPVPRVKGSACQAARQTRIGPRKRRRRSAVPPHVSGRRPRPGSFPRHFSRRRKSTRREERTMMMFERVSTLYRYAFGHT